MKLIINCLLLILLTTGTVFGRQEREGKQRIHAAKMAYIADRLKLQPEQSGKFIPIYNEYEQDLRTVRKKYFKKYHVREGKEGEKEAKGDKLKTRYQVEEDLDYQQDVIVLKRKYNDRFLNVLNATQLSDLYVAEREFRHMLMQRLKQERKEKARK